MSARLPVAAVALALLSACGGHAGDKTSETDNGQASAEGRAEEGKISVKAPGIDMTFVLPKAMRGEAKVDKNSKILYPGATIGGLAVVGTQAKGEKDGGDSEVEFRFATVDPPDRVAAWYRDPARAADLKVAKAAKEGADIIITGTQPGDAHPFKVRLSPREGGGTEGRLTIHHND
jgi:hypothetical protein